jgi:hypothetical protein
MLKQAKSKQAMLKQTKPKSEVVPKPRNSKKQRKRRTKGNKISVDDFYVRSKQASLNDIIVESRRMQMERFFEIQRREDLYFIEDQLNKPFYYRLHINFDDDDDDYFVHYKTYSG